MHDCIQNLLFNPGVHVCVQTSTSAEHKAQQCLKGTIFARLRQAVTTEGWSADKVCMQ